MRPPGLSTPSDFIHCAYVCWVIHLVLLSGSFSSGSSVKRCCLPTCQLSQPSSIKVYRLGMPALTYPKRASRGAHGLISECVRLGYSPVKKEALEGAQSGDAAYAVVNVTPSCASAEIFGVISPMTSARNWSAMMTIIGGGAFRCPDDRAAISRHAMSKREKEPYFMVLLLVTR